MTDARVTPDDAASTYLDHLRVERRLSSHTIESYGRDLAALAIFAHDAGRPIESLDRQALEAFARQQRTQGLSPRSVARSVAALRGFYRFLVLERRIEHSPADDLQPPRAWPALPRFLSIEDVDALLAQPDCRRRSGSAIARCSMLLYATGMRVSELVGVRAGDLHLDEGYLTCIGKGNKERLIPIGEQAADSVRRYAREGRPSLVGGPKRGRSKSGASARFFVNARGGPLSRVGFWKILKRHGAAASLPRDAEPARHPPLVCDALARTRRRPARHSDDARARGSFDDADLHARPGSAFAGRVQPFSPTSLIC